LKNAWAEVAELRHEAILEHGVPLVEPRVEERVVVAPVLLVGVQ
jgi:hypothetical protein